jgi:hypothetical protein
MDQTTEVSKPMQEVALNAKNGVINCHMFTKEDLNTTHSLVLTETTAETQIQERVFGATQPT